MNNSEVTRIVDDRLRRVFEEIRALTAITQGYRRLFNHLNLDDELIRREVAKSYGPLQISAETQEKIREILK